MKNLWGSEPQLSSVVFQGDYSLRLTPGSITIEDYAKSSIDTEIIFNGTLGELCGRLEAEEAITSELVQAKLKIRELEQAMTLLEDNQVREPV